MGQKYKMRVSQDHWQMMLEFAEVHPVIITNKFADHLQGRQNLKKLWEELSNKLNSLGQGIRTVEEWKKTLADWKSKTKKKASENAKDLVKTGGGPSSRTPLTSMEEKLISLMGTSAVYGDKSASEIGIKRKHEDILSAKEIVLEDEIIIKRKHDAETPSTSNDFTEEIIFLNVNDDDDKSHFPVDTPSTSKLEKSKVSVTNQSSTPKVTSAKKNFNEMHLEVLEVLQSIDSRLEGLDSSMKSIAGSLDQIAKKLQPHI